MKRSRWIALAIAAGVTCQLTGCGQGVPSTRAIAAQSGHQETQQAARTLPAQPSPSVEARTDERLMAADPVAEIRQHHEAMLTALNISEDQRAEIKAIKAKYRQQTSLGAVQANMRRLKDLVTASTVDPEAIKAAISDLKASYAALIPTFSAMLGEVRDVLSGEQQTAAVTLFNESGTTFAAMTDRLRDRAFDKLIAGMSLNSTQMEALEEFKEADKASDDAKMGMIRQAMIQFMMDGNQQALSTTLKSTLEDDATDEGITWLSTLSQDQRKTFVKNVDATMTQYMAMLHRN